VVEENPYKPTTAALREPPRPPRSPVSAILAGLGVDVGGSFLSSVVVAIAYSTMLAARGRTPEQMVEELIAVTASTGYLIVGAIVGSAFSLLGGYLCARMVRRDEHRFGAIMAVLSMLIGLVLGGTRMGAGLHALMLLSTFVSVMAGAELGRRRNVADERKANVATAA